VCQGGVGVEKCLALVGVPGEDGGVFACPVFVGVKGWYGIAVGVGAAGDSGEYQGDGDGGFQGVPLGW